MFSIVLAGSCLHALSSTQGISCPSAHKGSNLTNLNWFFFIHDSKKIHSVIYTFRLSRGAVQTKDIL